MTNGGQPRRLLLCEGPDDALFFRALIEARRLPAFRVKHNGTKSDPRGGNTKFGSGLKAHYELQGGRRRFDKVLIVSDNDDNPQDSFDRVRGQVEQFFPFAAPTAPGTSVPGPPLVRIQMIPENVEVDDLETLCLEAARHADAAIASHVDNFAALVGTDRWPHERRSKEMWLRSNLAARCQRDPFVTLQNVFTNRHHQNLIPLNHPSFQNISDVLTSLG
jgi:hypothetical protein